MKNLRDDNILKLPDGYAQDVINQSRPWPFDLTEIKKKVPNAGHLWHIEHLCTVLMGELSKSH